METNKAWQECLDEARKEMPCITCNGTGEGECYDYVDSNYCCWCRGNTTIEQYQLAAEKYAVRFVEWFIDECHYSGVELHQRFIEENNK